MDEKKETKITDLNTSCLIEIFKKLNNEDLQSLKKARNSFGAAVDFVVRTSNIRFKIEAIGINQEQDSQYVKQIRKIKKFLQEFGGTLKRLDIEIDGALMYHVSSISYHFQTIIENYCSNGNIKHCSLRNFELSTEYVEENLLFLRSLRSLEINYQFSNAELLCLMDFIIGSRIEIIKIHSLSFPIQFNILKKIALSRLKAVSIFGSFEGENFDDYGDLDIPVNTALKTLILPWFSFDSAYLPHFPNIKVLEYVLYSYPSNHVNDLVKLKKLGLTYNSEEFGEISSVFERLTERNSLKYLALDDSYCTEYAEVYGTFHHSGEEDLLSRILCKMTNLEELHLETIFWFKNDLPQIARSLRNLKTFCYDPATRFYEIEVHQILPQLLEFVKLAKNLVELTVGIPLKEFSQHFYEELVKIRRLQEANNVLYVYITDSQQVATSAEQRKFVKILID